MLVLNRQRDEVTVIVVPPSDQPTVIEAICVDIRGDKTRTGWAAPDNAIVHRKEVYDAILREHGVSDISQLTDLLVLRAPKLPRRD